MSTFFDWDDLLEAPYTSYRPKVSPVTAPRAWWKYIIQATIYQIRCKKRAAVWMDLKSINDELYNQILENKSNSIQKPNNLDIPSDIPTTMEGLRKEIIRLRQENERLKSLLSHSVHGSPSHLGSTKLKTSPSPKHVSTPRSTFVKTSPKDKKVNPHHSPSSSSKHKLKSKSHDSHSHETDQAHYILPAQSSNNNLTSSSIAEEEENATQHIFSTEDHEDHSISNSIDDIDEIIHTDLHLGGLESPESFCDSLSDVTNEIYRQQQQQPPAQQQLHYSPNHVNILLLPAQQQYTSYPSPPHPPPDSDHRQRTPSSIKNTTSLSPPRSANKAIPSPRMPTTVSAARPNPRKTKVQQMYYYKEHRVSPYRCQLFPVVRKTRCYSLFL
jgi:hypothetical protein